MTAMARDRRDELAVITEFSSHLKTLVILYGYKFLCPTLVTKRKTSFFISLPSSKLTISLISIYKHYAIDVADPSSMQDACHMNFVIELVHRGVCGSVV